MINKKIESAIKKQMAVAMGCTEPVAIAYAGCVARNFAEGEIKNITLIISKSILKNSFVVGIPGTNFSGPSHAVAVGCMCTDPDKKLAVLESLQEDGCEKADSLVKQGKVNVIKSDAEEKLFIEVNLVTSVDNVNVIISEKHTNVVSVIKNGKVMLKSSGCVDNNDELINTTQKFGFNLKDIYNYCTTVDVNEIPMVAQSIELNSKICKEGLSGDYGLKVGKMIKKSIDKKYLSDDLTNYAMMVTSAGSDARMAGVKLPVITNSGSGNQGIAATMPVVAVWEKIDNKDKEKLIRACAISNLTAIHIKENFGMLSALCGAVISAAGVACAITYLLGGTFEQMENSIQNTLGNVSGIICDGAKGSCALKISTCTNAAMQATFLALNNSRIKSNEGIVDNKSEQTINNFAILGTDSTESLDNIILKMIINKQNN